MNISEMCADIDAAFAEYVYEPPPQWEKIKLGSPAKHLYLPVEVFARDMHHRARLVQPAIDAGFDVLLGASWNMMHRNWEDLPPGVVILKSANALDAISAFYCNRAGHGVAIMNEELFSLPPEEWLYQINLDPNAIRMADVVLAHGDKSARLIDKMFPHAIVGESGTPRSWPIQYSPGDKIVVCSMAGTIKGNAAFKDYIAMSLRALKKPPSENLKRLIVEQAEHEYRHYQFMLALTHRLEEQYPGQVIYRPHPVEKSDYPHDAMPFMDRLKTAACVVFISGCGTGLEATLAGVPCVRIGDGGFGISRELGLAAGTEIDSALAAVAMCMNTGIVKMPIGFMRANYSPDHVMDAISLAIPTREWDGNLAAAIQYGRDFEPNAFQRNKFREVTADEVFAMTGIAPQTVGWNLWYFKP